MEILELKYIRSEIKISLDELPSKLNSTEEKKKNTEIEDREIK